MRHRVWLCCRQRRQRQLQLLFVVQLFLLRREHEVAESTNPNGTMPYLIGITVAVMMAALARTSRLDRDAAFYPTVLMVVASYYVLFAAMAGSFQSAVIEAGVTAAFVIIATAGFRNGLWLVVVGLALHGVLDRFHGSIIANPGVPAWWPSFCLSFDVAAAMALAGLLVRASTASTARTARTEP